MFLDRVNINNYSEYSGPFLICFNRMLISTASIVENRIRKRKKVMATLDDWRSLTAAHVGSMSWMVQG